MFSLATLVECTDSSGEQRRERVKNQQQRAKNETLSAAAATKDPNFRDHYSNKTSTVVAGPARGAVGPSSEAACGAYLE